MGFLYPPFEAGIEIPLTTPCSVLFGLKQVGVKLAEKTRDEAATTTRTAKVPHVPHRGLGPAAMHDDATAVAIEASARRAVVVRTRGSNMSVLFLLLLSGFDGTCALVLSIYGMSEHWHSFQFLREHS